MNAHTNTHAKETPAVIKAVDRQTNRQTADRVDREAYPEAFSFAAASSSAIHPSSTETYCSDQVKSGQVRSSPVKSGQVRSSPVKSVKAVLLLEHASYISHTATQHTINYNVNIHVATYTSSFIYVQCIDV